MNAWKISNDRLLVSRHVTVQHTEPVVRIYQVIQVFFTQTKKDINVSVATFTLTGGSRFAQFYSLKISEGADPTFIAFLHTNQTPLSLSSDID